MIKCQVCSTELSEDSQYCDECGSSLNGNPRKSSKLVSGSLASDSRDAQFLQGANVTSVGIPPVFEEAGKQILEKSKDISKPQLGAHASLVIERGEDVGTEFVLSADESYIGRWDADNGVFPDVDLDAYDTEAKVSRRHSRITLANGRYVIEDLGSTNGTFVNRGRRLIPGNGQELNDGDEVIVGKIFLRFNIMK